MVKHRRFRLRKCDFGVLAVKYQQSGLSKNADTVWTENSVKYENVIMVLSNAAHPTWNSEKKTEVGKQGVRSLYLFEITKWKL